MVIKFLAQGNNSSSKSQPGESNLEPYQADDTLLPELLDGFLDAEITITLYTNVHLRFIHRANIYDSHSQYTVHNNICD